jgi:hypothetical protein
MRFERRAEVEMLVGPGLVVVPLVDLGLLVQGMTVGIYFQ